MLLTFSFLSNFLFRTLTTNLLNSSHRFLVVLSSRVIADYFKFKIWRLSQPKLRYIRDETFRLSMSVTAKNSYKLEILTFLTVLTILVHNNLSFSDWVVALSNFGLVNWFGGSVIVPDQSNLLSLQLFHVLSLYASFGWEQKPFLISPMLHFDPAHN